MKRVDKVTNAWGLLCTMLDNVKQSMHYTISNTEDITEEDVINVVKYIENSMEQIIKANNIKRHEQVNKTD